MHPSPTCCHCAIKALIGELKNRLTKLDVKKIEEKYDVNTKPKSDLVAGKNFRDFEQSKYTKAQNKLREYGNKKIWRVLNSELIKAILSKVPWLKGLIQSV